MRAWPGGVNTKVRRDTTGTVPVGVTADETRCGRKRVRASNQLSPRTFSVTMMFTYDEFALFEDWFHGELRRGAESFLFPRINSPEGGLVEYRFTPGSSYGWENTSGKIVRVSMEWETVTE